MARPPHSSRPAVFVESDALDPETRALVDTAAKGSRVVITRKGRAIGALIGVDDLRILDHTLTGEVPERRHPEAPTLRHLLLAQKLVDSRATTKPEEVVARVLALWEAGVSPKGIGEELAMQPRTVTRIIDAAQL